LTEYEQTYDTKTGGSLQGLPPLLPGRQGHKDERCKQGVSGSSRKPGA